MKHPQPGTRSAAPFRIKTGTLAIVAALAGFISAPAFAAQPTAAVRQYTIPAGNLGDVLAQYAASAGVQLVVDPALVDKGKTSPGLKGDYSVQAGFAALLAGTGLEAFRQEDGSYGLRAAPMGSRSGDTQLARVVVTADGERETAWGPVQGYAAKRSATGTRTDTPLIQTPLSVQVISREVMDDQQVLRVADAVKNVSGVYVMQGPDGNTMDAFNIRGFQAAAYGATYLDGVKDFSRAPKETAGLERIEVLKGPSAIMYGRIEPGGMINRVSKIPLADKFTRIQQQVGSDNYLPPPWIPMASCPTMEVGFTVSIWLRNRATVSSMTPTSSGLIWRRRLSGAPVHEHSSAPALNTRKTIVLGRIPTAPSAMRTVRYRYL